MSVALGAFPASLAVADGAAEQGAPQDTGQIGEAAKKVPGGLGFGYMFHLYRWNIHDPIFSVKLNQQENFG